MYKNRYFLYPLLFFSFTIVAMNSKNSNEKNSPRSDKKDQQYRDVKMIRNRLVLDGMEVTPDDIMKGRLDGVTIPECPPSGFGYTLFGRSQEKVTTDKKT